MTVASLSTDPNGNRTIQFTSPNGRGRPKIRLGKVPIKAAESVRDLEVDWEIRSGDVVETLSELDDVDVLFCGSRGYGPARRVLLGGVSTRLVRGARRPLVLVPRSG